jgi:hypothetical protein
MRRRMRNEEVYAPITVPGVSWTQYSASGLVKSRFQIRIASYLEI